jgi:Protein of unknown function (DUF4089)
MATDASSQAPVDAYVDAAAATLGLKISAEQRGGVLMYFRLAAQMAARLDGMPLGPADESGNVFRPVAPLTQAGSGERS